MGKTVQGDLGQRENRGEGKQRAVAYNHPSEPERDEVDVEAELLTDAGREETEASFEPLSEQLVSGSAAGIKDKYFATRRNMDPGEAEIQDQANAAEAEGRQGRRLTEPHIVKTQDALESFIEVTTGMVARRYLGNRSPKYRLATARDGETPVLTAKFLKGYRSLDSILGREDLTRTNVNEFGLRGIEDVMAASIFTGDFDWHLQNMGMVEDDQGRSVVGRIDYGLSTAFTSRDYHSIEETKLSREGVVEVVRPSRKSRYASGREKHPNNYPAHELLVDTFRTRAYDPDIYKHEDFIEALEQTTDKDMGRLERVVDATIDYQARYQRPEVFTEFLDYQEVPASERTDNPAEDAKRFLKDAYRERHTQMLDLARNLRVELALSQSKSVEEINELLTPEGISDEQRGHNIRAALSYALLEGNEAMITHAEGMAEEHGVDFTLPVYRNYTIDGLRHKLEYARMADLYMAETAEVEAEKGETRKIARIEARAEELRRQALEKRDKEIEEARDEAEGMEVDTSEVERKYQQKLQSINEQVDASATQIREQTNRLRARAAINLRKASGLQKSLKSLNKRAIMADRELSEPTRQLHLAILNENQEGVRQAISEGADVNAIASGTGMNALHLAAYLNNRNAMNSVIESGADLGRPNARGLQAIHLAALQHNTEATQCLRGHGADLHALSTTTPQRTALECAAGNPNSRFFADLGVDINAELPPYGRTLVTNAARIGNFHNVAELVQAGADINQRDREGMTAMHHIAKRRNLTVLNRFIALGGDPTIATEDGRTALGIVREARVDLNRPDLKGNTMLVTAIFNGNTAAIRGLKEHGVALDLDVPLSNGMPPLLHAIAQKDKAMVRTLIDCGANVNLAAPDGSPAFILRGAIGGKAHEIAEILVEAGAEITSQIERYLSRRNPELLQRLGEAVNRRASPAPSIAQGEHSISISMSPKPNIEKSPSPKQANPPVAMHLAPEQRGILTRIRQGLGNFFRRSREQTSQPRNGVAVTNIKKGRGR